MAAFVNTISLRKCLDRSEAQEITTVTPSQHDPLLTMLQVLIAHHLGNAGPSDSIAVAMARSLGLGQQREKASPKAAEPAATVSEKPKRAGRPRKAKEAA